MPFFRHSDTTLFYTTSGSPSSPSILLLHGGFTDSHDWSWQIPYLNTLNLHVIVLDHRGHGQSSAPQSPTSYTPEILAADAVALLKHLKTGPAIIMAHSLGTVVASIIAVEHPESVKALVLVHPLYSATPSALIELRDTIMPDPSAINPDAGELVAAFFGRFMYVSGAPEWLKTWHARRTLGMDPVAVAGILDGLTGCFGTIMGMEEKQKEFMRKRTQPRLVFGVLPTAAGWERAVGLKDGLDRLEVLDKGVFSHCLDAERVNVVLGEWLTERGLLGEREGGEAK